MIKLTRGEGEVIRGALQSAIDLAYDLHGDLSYILEDLEDARGIISSVLDYRDEVEIID